MTTEERLEKVEKELCRAKRRSRVMLVAVAMTVALMLLLGAGNETVQKVVRAERFELVDSTGNARAGLSLDSGRPGLSLRDQNGKVRAGLQLTESGQPRLDLFDQNDTDRIMLCLCDSWEPVLVLSDQNGKDRAWLALSESGQPSLDMVDQTGKTRAVLGATQTKTPDGRTITYPESSLLLFGPDGKQIWSAP